MQTGVKKRTELHEKYQDKFKELGVSILYVLCLSLMPSSRSYLV